MSQDITRAGNEECKMTSPIRFIQTRTFHVLIAIVVGIALGTYINVISMAAIATRWFIPVAVGVGSGAALLAIFAYCRRQISRELIERTIGTSWDAAINAAPAPFQPLLRTSGTLLGAVAAWFAIVALLAFASGTLWIAAQVGSAAIGVSQIRETQEQNILSRNMLAIERRAFLQPRRDLLYNKLSIDRLAAHNSQEDFQRAPSTLDAREALSELIDVQLAQGYSSPRIAALFLDGFDFSVLLRAEDRISKGRFIQESTNIGFLVFGIDLSRASMDWSKIRLADLHSALLIEASLIRVDFRETNINKCSFVRADMHCVDFIQMKSFTDCDLRGAKLTECVFPPEITDRLFADTWVDEHTIISPRPTWWDSLIAATKARSGNHPTTGEYVPMPNYWDALFR